MGNGNRKTFRGYPSSGNRPIHWRVSENGTKATMVNVLGKREDCPKSDSASERITWRVPEGTQLQALNTRTGHIETLEFFQDEFRPVQIMTWWRQTCEVVIFLICLGLLVFFCFVAGYMLSL